MLVFVLNCGSSSIKFAAINPSTNKKVLSGLIECIATKNGYAFWHLNNSKKEQSLPNISYQDAIKFIISLLKENNKIFSNIIAVGHRVVHGGEYFVTATIITPEVLAIIKKCAILAPLHNPANIIGITLAQKYLPDLPHVAVFDTSFHQTLPPHAYLYAIPYQLYEQHKIRKYGFHGISHRYVANEAARILEKPLTQCNLITAHLGNGCSLCAIKEGESVDTSMGFTPLEGLIMGTRSGSVDPGLHNYLAENMNYDHKQIDALLNKQSGLLGISQLSSDMRTLEEAAASNPLAKLAIEMFCYRLATTIGSYVVILGNLDALVFTGGIGENSVLVRAKTLKKLSILGFQLAEQANQQHGKQNNGLITEPNGSSAMVINTNEEVMIAKDSMEKITNQPEIV